ncbi:SGNH/GDSL hydrolase family protein [Paenibacillus sp. CN-4]|uniref:SGNH/GDSL hydrolase family protein n=1 Tax=Paenibacillus nanchangensis TaxID=3348343 RepID=UPI00397DC732
MYSATKIHIFGDSIMKGCIFDEAARKYRTLPEGPLQPLEDRYGVQVNNQSVYGYTIDKGYNRLRAAIAKGLDCTMALLEFGGNDCNYAWDEVSGTPEAEHSPRTPITRFESVYRSMIHELKKLKITPILMSLPPVDADKYFAFLSSLKGVDKACIRAWLGDVQRIARYQELYSNTIVKIAYETKSLFVDVRSLFLDHANYKQLMCSDGIHPNADGHRLIKQAFADFASAYFPSLSPDPA